MKIKFQADADFSYTITKALRRRQPAIDFQSADDAELRGLPDPEVLAFAAKETRILVSHDCNTMPEHFANLWSRNTVQAYSSSRKMFRSTWRSKSF